MFLTWGTLFILVSIKIVAAQFDPVVSIDCKNGVGDVDVIITSGASGSGKVSMYVSTTMCDEQSTTAGAVTISFTDASGCNAGSGTYPGTTTQFIIYVTEGANVQAGLPDEAYEVMCNVDNTESVTQLVLTTVGTITDPVTPSVDLTITDASDVTVTSLIVGDSYKFKINCQTAFVNDFDIIVQKIVANSVVTLIDSGCVQSPNDAFFNTPTHPSQCSLEAVFDGFMVAATTTPEVLVFDTWIQVCGGACATPTNCAPSEPAWGRKRRDTTDGQTNTTIESVHLLKQIVVYPSVEMKQEYEEARISPPAGKNEMCFSHPIVYFVFSLLVLLLMVTAALAVLLFMARRRLRSRGRHGLHQWSHSSKASLRESTDSRKY